MRTQEDYLPFVICDLDMALIEIKQLRKMDGELEAEVLASIEATVIGVINLLRMLEGKL